MDVYVCMCVFIFLNIPELFLILHFRYIIELHNKCKLIYQYIPNIFAGTNQIANVLYETAWLNGSKIFLDKNMFFFQWGFQQCCYKDARTKRKQKSQTFYYILYCLPYEIWSTLFSKLFDKYMSMTWKAGWVAIESCDQSLCAYTSSVKFKDLVWASAVSNITLPLKQGDEMWS